MKIDLRACHSGLTFVVVYNDFKQRKTCTSKDEVCGLVKCDAVWLGI